MRRFVVLVLWVSLLAGVRHSGLSIAALGKVVVAAGNSGLSPFR